jgi:hypothetical protein
MKLSPSFSDHVPDFSPRPTIPLEVNDLATANKPQIVYHKGPKLNDPISSPEPVEVSSLFEHSAQPAAARPTLPPPQIKTQPAKPQPIKVVPKPRFEIPVQRPAPPPQIPVINQSQPTPARPEPVPTPTPIRVAPSVTPKPQPRVVSKKPGSIKLQPPPKKVEPLKEKPVIIKEPLPLPKETIPALKPLLNIPPTLPAPQAIPVNPQPHPVTNLNIEIKLPPVPEKAPEPQLEERSEPVLAPIPRNEVKKPELETNHEEKQDFVPFPALTLEPKKDKTDEKSLLETEQDLEAQAKSLQEIIGEELKHIPTRTIPEKVLQPAQIKIVPTIQTPSQPLPAHLPSTEAPIISDHKIVTPAKSGIKAVKPTKPIQLYKPSFLNTIKLWDYFLPRVNPKINPYKSPTRAKAVLGLKFAGLIFFAGGAGVIIYNFHAFSVNVVFESFSSLTIGGILLFMAENLNIFFEPINPYKVHEVT